MLYTVQNTVKVGKPVDVYLNGSQVKFAISADDEQGWVEVSVFDRKGCVVLDGYEIKTEKKYGKVRVEYKK